MTTVPDAENVSDPTDFPMSIGGLRALDDALRCPICGDIFDAPMSLPCGHSFCSLCIRRSILRQNECPRCRKQTNEFHLVKNAHLEEAALSWKVARPAILDLITKLENAKVEAEQLRVRLEKGKAKASPDACTEEGEPRSRPNKRRRTSDDEAPSTAKNGVVDLAAEEEEDEDEDAAYPDFVPSSDVEEQAIQDDSIVDCPMGTHKTYMEHINVHLDSGCKLHTYKLGRRRGTAGKPAPAPSNKNKSASSKSAWNNVFQSNSGTSSRDRGKGKDSRSPSTTSANERLPKVSYGVLKDKKIRELLQEHGLPFAGTRDQQNARHLQFVTLYNANLDRPLLERKTTDELRKELREWEKGLSVKKAEVTDPKAYLKRNSEQFNVQIKALKERRQREGAARDNKNDAVVCVEGVERDASAPLKSPRVDQPAGRDDVISDSEGEGEIRTSRSTPQ